MLRFLLPLILLTVSACYAGGPVYVVLWFDTEDYVEPASDDAALRLARDLTQLGVRATFKVVGEKARTLEQRGRWDVIRALNRHEIGYHSNYHSMHPTPAEYLRDLGFLEGVAEFERRESPGVADLRRIFGTVPVCYGQPGSSWGPQSNPVLRKLGIPVYLDEGDQVGLNDQPFWYGGLLHVFHMGRYLFRPEINDEATLAPSMAQFDKIAAELGGHGGGVISSYYHPCEFATTEFWDAVNFKHGANPERSEWKLPNRKTPEQSETGYRIVRQYVQHALRNPDVRFVTARELLQLYRSPVAPAVDISRVREHLRKGITFLDTEAGSLSAADMLLALLNVEPRYVDGPTSRGTTTWKGGNVPRPVFERAKADAASFILHNHRLPAAVWLGGETLSLSDFTATLASDDGSASKVAVQRGELVFEKQFSNEAVKAWDWVIHAEGFSAPKLVELAKLQGWTLKPARLR